jgi:hypothetical protein
MPQVILPRFYGHLGSRVNLAGEVIHEQAEEWSGSIPSASLGRVQGGSLGPDRARGSGQRGQATGLHESQLYDRREKARYEAGSSELEKELAAENARLKLQVAEQAEELAN